MIVFLVVLLLIFRNVGECDILFVMKVDFILSWCILWIIGDDCVLLLL